MAVSWRLLLPVLLCGACAELGSGPLPDEGDDGGGSLGTPTRFQVTSEYDGLAALPPAVQGTLEILGSFDEDPGASVVALLASADVGWLSSLLDLLGEPIEDWINDYLAGQLHDGVPVAEEIAAWARDISGLLGDFEIHSHFLLGVADDAGETIAEHSLSGVTFKLRGESHLVDTSELLNLLTTAREVPCRLTRSGAGHALAVGDHAFQLPLGGFASNALSNALAERTGERDLAGALGTLLDCPGLAEEIVSRCGGCAPYEASIAAACSAGIDVVAGSVEQWVESLEVAELRLSAGAGVLVGGQDQTGAPAFERIEGGTWQAAFTLDRLALPVDATFAGRRVEF